MAADNYADEGRSSSKGYHNHADGTGDITGAADATAPLNPLGVPQPSDSLRDELVDALYPVKELFLVDDPFDKYRGQSWPQRAKIWLLSVLPVLQWLPNYKLSYLTGDIIAGLTIASLAVPQVSGKQWVVRSQPGSH